MEYTEIIEEVPFVPDVVHPSIIAREFQQAESTAKPFIEANTIASSLEEISNQHIIPVYIKDNEPLISQADFIDCCYQTANEYYNEERILRPSVRVSHPIKGRIPEAKNKQASELLENEKTLYYERMAFIIEVPSISKMIDGNLLSLTIGGVKSYSLDNLYSKKGSNEHFKIFIGFKNTVCCNLCVWTDGYMSDVNVSDIGQLKSCIRILLENYNNNYHLFHLEELTKFSITEKQFALIAGRIRMYYHLPNDLKQGIQEILLTDTQLGMVVKDYYRDNSFCRNEDGTINLWRLYNLFTSANKSTYIDNFLDRSVNACHFIEQIRFALEGRRECWYLS